MKSVGEYQSALETLLKMQAIFSPNKQSHFHSCMKLLSNMVEYAEKYPWFESKLEFLENYKDFKPKDFHPNKEDNFLYDLVKTFSNERY